MNSQTTAWSHLIIHVLLIKINICPLPYQAVAEDVISMENRLQDPELKRITHYNFCLTKHWKNTKSVSLCS
jgi:hypothetical protein